MNLKRLEHLTLLAEELSFARAAERANLSQTAFSSSIQILEQELGLKLFDRTTRSVKLTASGTQLVGRALDVLRRARDFKKDADYLRDAKGGELAIGSNQMAADGVLLHLMPKLLEKIPQLKVRIEVNQRPYLARHLLEERIEFYVGYPGDLTEDPIYSVIDLKPQGFSFFCHPRHPLVSGRGAPTLADALKYRWATHHVEPSIVNRVRRLFGLSSEIDLPFAFMSDSPSMLRQVALMSDMILVTSKTWPMDDVKSGALIDLGKQILPANISKQLFLQNSIVYLSGRTLSPIALHLIDLCVADANLAKENRAN